MKLKQATSKLFKVGILLSLGVIAIAVIATSIQPKTANAVTALNELNFQGRLLNATGGIVPDGSYNLDFKIFNLSNSSGSTNTSCNTDIDCEWSDGYYSGGSAGVQVQVTDGYFSVQLGQFTALPNTINWYQPQWLGVRVGGTAGTPSWDTTDLLSSGARIPLTSIPYAFTASQLGNYNGSTIQTLNWGGTTGNDAITLPDQAGGYTGVVCLVSNSTECGYATTSGDGNYIENQNAGAQSSANFNISGTGTVSSLFTAAGGAVDTVSGGSGILNIGNTNATTINLGKTNGTGTVNDFSQTIIGNTTTASNNYFEIQSISGLNVLNANTTNSSINIGQLSPPTTVNTELAPKVWTPAYNGATGSSTDIYEISAVLSNGAVTIPSPTVSYTTASSSLSASVYNILNYSGSLPTGSATVLSYNIYRTEFNGSTSSGVGLMANTTATTWNDTGTNPILPLPSVQSGSLTAAAYNISVTAVDGTSGETTATAVGSTTTAATTTNSAINVSWAPVSGARYYNVYFCEPSCTPNAYFTTYSNSYNLTTTSGATSASPPTSSTANAYNDTLGATGSSQITLGNYSGDGSSAQLDVAGYVSSAVVGSSTNTTSALNSYSGGYISGNYEYLISGFANDMQIFDISSPANPVLISTTGITNAQAVSVQGRVAFVATNSGSIVVYDVSDPAAPVVVKNFTGLTSNSAATVSMAILGNYAYLIYGQSTGNNIQVVNITNPLAPFIVTADNATLPGGSPQSISIQGDYAYILNTANTLQVVDLYTSTTPSVPITTSPLTVANTSLSTNGTTLDTATNAGVTAPAQAATINFANISVQGRYAYIVSGTSTPVLQIFDVSNPNAPTQVSTFSLGSGSTIPSSIYMQGHNAYITDYAAANFQVVDVSNPLNPVGIGSPTSTTAGSNATNVIILGRYAYIACNPRSTSEPGFQIYNIGGAYIQQLQAGGVETGTLQVDSNELISGNSNIAGNLAISGNDQINGNLGVVGVLTSTTALIQPFADTATAFVIENAANDATLPNTSILTVDTNSNVGTTSIGRVDIGTGTGGDTAPVLLVLDNCTGTACGVTTDPTGLAGGMYYDAATSSFRCFEGSTWVNCVGGLLYSDTNTSPSADTCNNTGCSVFANASTYGLSSLNIPTGYCAAGRVIHITASGIMSTSSVTTGMGQWLIKAGTTPTTIAENTAGGTLATTVSNGAWVLDLYITCDSTTVITVGGNLTYSSTNTSSANQVTLPLFIGTTNSVTPTGGTAGTISITPSITQSGASPTASITLEQLIMTGT